MIAPFPDEKPDKDRHFSLRLIRLSFLRTTRPPNDSPSQRTRGIAADAGGEGKDSVLSVLHGVLPVLHGVLSVLHGVLPIPHGILRVAAPAVFKFSIDCLPGLHGVWQTL